MTLLRGVAGCGLAALLLCALGLFLLLSAAEALLTGQNATLSTPTPCTSAKSPQGCAAPNEVAATVVYWAEAIADHLAVDPACGTLRRFPDCFYTWKAPGFPEEVTRYSERWCTQTGDSPDCRLAWGLTTPERFQCVSLVRGAYALVYPMPTSNNAFQLWGDYKQRPGWKAIAATAPDAPRGLPLPGDIVIIRKYTNTNAGHTGIVTEVSAPDAHGDRQVRYANANGAVPYDTFTVHPDESVPPLWGDPGVSVWGYLRPDLPTGTTA